MTERPEGGSSLRTFRYRLLYRGYYALMRHAPTRLNRWLWRHWALFRKWWGAMPGW